jgi:hypothetical protein
MCVSPRKPQSSATAGPGHKEAFVAPGICSGPLARRLRRVHVQRQSACRLSRRRAPRRWLVRRKCNSRPGNGRCTLWPICQLVREELRGEASGP